MFEVEQGPEVSSDQHSGSSTDMTNLLGESETDSTEVDSLPFAVTQQQTTSASNSLLDRIRAKQQETASNKDPRSSSTSLSSDQNHFFSTDRAENSNEVPVLSKSDEVEEEDPTDPHNIVQTEDRDIADAGNGSRSADVTKTSSQEGTSFNVETPSYYASPASPPQFSHLTHPTQQYYDGLSTGNNFSSAMEKGTKSLKSAATTLGSSLQNFKSLVTERSNGPSTKDNEEPLIQVEEVGEYGEQSDSNTLGENYDMKSYFVTFCTDMYGFTLGRLEIYTRVAVVFVLLIFFIWLFS